MFSFNPTTSTQPLAIFITLFTILRIIKFVPTTSAPIYYSIWGICAFYIIISGYHRVNYSTLLFIFFCFLSIIGNSIDAKYNIGLRFTGFLLIVGSVGPLFTGEWLYSLRRNCFHYVSVGLVFVTVVSFLIYCIYPSAMITTRGHLYGGMTLHSMQMGPIAGLSTIYLTYKFLITKQDKGLRDKMFYIVGICISLLSCILAGSRSAILSMIISGIVCLYLYYRNDMAMFFKIIICVIVILAITSPLWWSYTEAVQAKIAISESRGGLITARSFSWKARMEEFLQNPFIGCGFATVVGTLSERGNEGMVEPGNGWLFILSSTGIVSFILFVTMYIRYVVMLVKDAFNESILLVSSLVFIGLHLNAEGYTLSSGIFLFYYLWLSIGYTYSYLFK